MHAIRTEDYDPQQNAAHQVIQIAKLWTIRRWSESKLENRRPLVQIPKQNAHLGDRKWNENEPGKLRTIVEKYTSQGASGAGRVYRLRLPYFTFLLGDTAKWNNVSRRWCDDWPLNTWVDSAMFQ
jgi:hypothetical protein